MGVHEFKRPVLEEVFHMNKIEENVHQIDRNKAVLEISNIIKQQQTPKFQ